MPAFGGLRAEADPQAGTAERKKTYQAMQPGWSGLQDLAEVCRKFNSLPAAQSAFRRSQWTRLLIDSDQVLKIYFNLKE